MDETIGVKGGRNDRKRMLKISKLQKEKLIEKQKEKELKDLEKKVKKQQIYTLIKTLPIAIGGGTFKILYDIGTGKKDIDKQVEYSKWRIKEYDADMSTKSRQEVQEEKRNKKEKKIIVEKADGTKVIVLVPDSNNKKIDNYPISNIVSIDKKEEKVEKKTTTKKEDKENNESKKKEINRPVEEVIQNSIDIPKTEILEDKIEILDNSFDNLTSDQKEKLDKLRARKIIDEYEKQLKSIRFDLRQLVYDYNVLVDEGEKSLTSKELNSILDRLNEVIRKVEELKNKIQIENLDKYDDNYIYTLIENYLLEFKDKKIIKEIKDSPLYVLISEKIDELDTKKDKLKKDVEDKKELLEEKEEDFKKIREKYYNIDKINKELVEFQKEQELLLQEIKTKIDNAVSVSERVQVEMEAMSLQSRRLLRRLTMAMLFPGSRAAKGLALSTTAYIHFARRLMNPRTITKKYKVVSVYDYANDIEYSINSINDAIGMLGKTNSQLDKLISQVKEEFKDYIGVFKECDELLSNLEKVKSDISEKEYEMKRIKKAQQRELERNNAKVLTRGEYRM